MPYFDHAASTALRPRARAAVLAAWDDGPANPTGAHTPAQRARARLESAREEIAALVGVPPSGVAFTSGGTEADNWAVAAGAGRGRVLYSAVEHPAVVEPAASRGGEPIPVDAEGVVDLDALEKQLRAPGRVGVVSVMAANNETGVIQPLAEVGVLVRDLAPEAWLHTDAVQAFGKEHLDTRSLDLISLSGHKLGAPIGTGALVLADGVRPDPLLLGGGQERGRRAGTPSDALTAGFAAAAKAAYDDDWARIGALRDRLETALRDEIDGLVVHGANAPRLPTHCHIGVPGVLPEMAVIACDRAGLAVSAGSSCASGALKESGVLAAMGVSDEGAMRLSLGWTTTEAEIDEAAGIVVDVVTRLRF